MQDVTNQEARAPAVVRIVGVKIPVDDRRVGIALQDIPGIGPKEAKGILTAVGILDASLVSELTYQEVLQIREVVDRDHVPAAQGDGLVDRLMVALQDYHDGWGSTGLLEDAVHDALGHGLIVRRGAGRPSNAEHYAPLCFEMWRRTGDPTALVLAARYLLNVAARRGLLQVAGKEEQAQAKCSVCGDEYRGYSNNAWPMNDGTCCDDCNEAAVIPARVRSIMEHARADA